MLQWKPGQLLHTHARCSEPSKEAIRSSFGQTDSSLGLAISLLELFKKSWRPGSQGSSLLVSFERDLVV